MEKEMRAALEAFRRQRLELTKQIELIDKTIEQMEATIEAISPSSDPKSTKYADMSIAEAARAFLTEKGSPATTREIADALIDNGVKTTSKNFSMTVYTILRETQGFERKTPYWQLASSKASKRT